MKAITRIVAVATLLAMLVMTSCSMPAPISIQPEQQQQTPSQAIGDWLRSVLQPYVRQAEAPAAAPEAPPEVHWPAQGAEFYAPAPLVNWPPLGAEVVIPPASQAAGVDLVDRHPGLTTVPRSIQLAGVDLVDRHPGLTTIPLAIQLAGEDMIDRHPAAPPDSLPAGEDMIDRHPSPAALPQWLVGPVLEPQSLPAGEDMIDRHPVP